VKVRILQLGRKVVDYEGPDGASLETALAASAIAVGQGMDLRVNSQPATLETVLNHSDVVTVIPRIKGGASMSAALLPSMRYSAR
jgi:molybdopterin converting factor small subunit